MAKSNIIRIILGTVWLIAGLGLLTPPWNAQSGVQPFVEWGTTVIPAYREFVRSTVLPNAELFIFLIAVLQIVSGVLILSKHVFVKLGLIGAISFNLMMALLVLELSLIELPIAALHGYLLTKDFDLTLLELIRTKLGSK